MELVSCSKCSKYVSHKIIGTYGVVICAYWSDGVHDRPLWRSAKDNQYHVNCPDGAKSIIFNPHKLNLPLCKETLSVAGKVSVYMGEAQ